MAISALKAQNKLYGGMGHFYIGSGVYTLSNLESELSKSTAFGNEYSMNPEMLTIGGGGFGLLNGKWVIGGNGFGAIPFNESQADEGFTELAIGGGFFDFGYVVYNQK